MTSHFFDKISESPSITSLHETMRCRKLNADESTSYFISKNEGRPRVSSKKRDIVFHHSREFSLPLGKGKTRLLSNGVDIPNKSIF